MNVSLRSFFFRTVIGFVGMLAGLVLSSESSGFLLVSVVSLINIVLAWTGRVKTVEAEKKQKQKDLLQSMKVGTWPFPSEEFCKKCQDIHIASLSSSYNIQKARLVAQQILKQHGVPDDVHTIYLSDQKLAQYFEEGSTLIRAKKEQAEKDRLEELRLQEIEKEKELTRFARYHGKDKRIAMIQAEIDKLNQTIQEWEQLERRNSRVIAAHKDTDGNWGLAGGIAEGLAGPAAGVAAAAQAQREAAITNQHNAVVRQQHGEIGRSIRDWIATYKQLKTGLEGELEKAKLAVVADIPSNDVFRHLKIACYPASSDITETGAIRIRPLMYVNKKIKVFGDVKAVVDGVVSATVYQEGKVVGTTKVVLPMGGVDEEYAHLEGIVLGSAKKGVEYTVKFAPVDLWIIEA